MIMDILPGINAFSQFAVLRLYQLTRNGIACTFSTGYIGKIIAAEMNVQADASFLREGDQIVPPGFQINFPDVVKPRETSRSLSSIFLFQLFFFFF